MLAHNLSKLFVVEYSCVQQCFHIETVDRMLKGNLEGVARNVVPGYVPLFVTANMQEADSFIEKLRPLVDNRPTPVNPASADGKFPLVTAGMSDMTFDQLMNKLNGE